MDLMSSTAVKRSCISESRDTLEILRALALNGHIDVLKNTSHITELAQHKCETADLFSRILANYQKCYEASMLHQQEVDERLQAIIDASPLSLTVWSRDLTPLDCSMAAVKLFGADSKEDLLNNLLTYCPERQPNGKNTLEMLKEEMAKTFELGSNQCEWTNLTKNGETVISEVNFERVRYNGDYAAVLYARDITAKKLMLATIDERDRQLKSQAYWYKSILDAVPLPIMVTDEDAKLTFVNSAAEKTFDTDRDNLLGKPCSIWNTEICNTENCSIARAKRGEMQTFFKRDDMSMQVNSEIIRDQEDNTVGFVEILQDVTLAENLARKQAEAESKAKSTLLATMSHEMRTPLNAIIGMTTIGSRTKDIDRKDYALEKINEASSHLLELINDVLDMSKIEANRLELHPTEFNLEHMLKRIMTIITYKADEKRQKLAVTINNNVPNFVIGDEQRIAQIVMNLLSNAVKFTPDEGNIEFSITTLGEQDGIHELQFQVSDNGIGISTDQIPRLFNSFVQAEGGISREYGGTGLGLAISKSLSDMMGGDIRVDSVFGQGSSFFFTVKLAAGKENIREMLTKDVTWKNVKVLVAESSAMTKQYLQDTFTRLGISCTAVNNCLDACRAVDESGPFDICFIDRHLPCSDEASIREWVTTHGGSSKIVITSTEDSQFLHDLVKRVGADMALPKPIFSSGLINCLNECLGIDAEIRTPRNINEFAGKSLLLVEDVEINREIVIALLENTGLKIHTAENGLDALSKLKHNPNSYDIIFMDMQMPVMDGLEATRCIRNMPAAHLKNVPIVAMTANVFKEDIEICLAAGMNDHIGKPINIDNTLTVLRKHLHGTPMAKCSILKAAYA